jgi:hypothetical protein
VRSAPCAGACSGSLVDESSDLRSGPRPSLGFVTPSSCRFLFGVIREESIILSGMRSLQELAYRMSPLRNA